MGSRVGYDDVMPLSAKKKAQKTWLRKKREVHREVPSDQTLDCIGIINNNEDADAETQQTERKIECLIPSRLSA